MHKLKQFTFALVAVCALSTACGQSGTAETPSASAAETKAETTVETTAAVESKAAVASGNETAAEQTIDTVGLVPVSAADLKDGTYDISVESSSSMFKIISCALTVKEGAMTARMTMGGTGYLYVYMGTGEEASKVPESDLISFEEDSDGTHSFTVPVETLNEVLPCTAFSKKKEKWYDRELVFEASGIPAGISGCVLSGSGSESDVQLQNNCTMNKRKTDRRNVVCILFSFLGIRLEGYFQKFQCKKKVKRDGGSHFP